MFYWMRENYPDFLCMKCNAHICCLYFVTSNPKILQSSQSFRSHTLLNNLVVSSIYLVVPSPTIWNIDGILCPEWSLNLLLSNSEQQLRFNSIHLGLFLVILLDYPCL
jgi:hypothetical protein